VTFDPEEYRRVWTRHEVREEADTDRRLADLRSVWEALDSAAHRERLRRSLYIAVVNARLLHMACGELHLSRLEYDPGPLREVIADLRAEGQEVGPSYAYRAEIGSFTVYLAKAYLAVCKWNRGEHYAPNPGDADWWVDLDYPFNSPDKLLKWTPREVFALIAAEASQPEPTP
jgi:hypothetical protein